MRLSFAVHKQTLRCIPTFSSQFSHESCRDPWLPDPLIAHTLFFGFSSDDMTICVFLVLSMLRFKDTAYWDQFEPCLLENFGSVAQSRSVDTFSSLSRSHVPALFDPSHGYAFSTGAQH